MDPWTSKSSQCLTHLYLLHPDPLFTACTPRPLFYPPVECFLGWQPGVLGERAGHVAASMGGARTFLIIPFLFWDALVLG